MQKINSRLDDIDAGKSLKELKEWVNEAYPLYFSNLEAPKCYNYIMRNYVYAKVGGQRDCICLACTKEEPNYTEGWKADHRNTSMTSLLAENLQKELVNFCNFITGLGVRGSQKIQR